MKDPTPDADDRAPAQETLFFSAEMGPWTKVANTIVLMVLMLIAVCFVWMMSSLPRIEGRFPVKGLDLPATVARDEAGIPHVTARSVRDAYFAIGWTHAQDRLWQMELQRRVAAGRLAETVGAAGLDSDRFLRTLGIRALAESGLDKLDKPTRDVLQAYADGINAWLRDHWHRLPPEYIILGIRPEPWSAADSLSIGRLMALQLTNDWRAELLRGKLAGRFDARRLGELWPDVTTDAPVTLGAVDTDRVLAAVPDTASPRLASNVWAISGEHTASGKPLLANDPHLGFQAPVQWYLLSVDAPGLSLSGGTIPGIPFHLVGHNGRIAWGTTTTHADTVDLYVEKLAGENSYLTPKGPEPFAERTETIKVKGSADVELRVRATRHGPVISDLSGDQVVSGQVIAMRTTALAADDLTAQAYHRLNRAIDWRGFSGALRDFGAPVQNFAYADMTGAIGFVTAGRVPTRPKGVNSAVPVRGWTAEGDWTGWIPTDKMPQQLNPKSGFVVNANNAVVGSRYPYQIASQWPEAYRAERIGQALAAHDGWTVAETAALQLDETSLPALTLKEELVSAPLSDPLAQQAARLIADWDGRMDRGRAEPLIFAAWLDQLWRDLLADELGDDFVAYGRPKADVVSNILNRNRHWCDDVSTTEAESCETISGRALERAVRTLAERHGGNMMTWRWGDDHQARFDNAVMGRLPLVGDGLNLAIATGGDDFTVNRGSYLPGSFRHVHGPGLRAIFDLSDLNNSRFVIATGQSGNALSRHYDDMIAAWRDNLGRTLERRTVGGAVLRLEPGY